MRTNNTFPEIKKRMLNKAMELWGINESHRIDPVIDLLLDAFAFEKERLYQEIEISDSNLLNRLSRILVDNKWSLPLPSHGLLRILPSEDRCNLTSSNHFYVNKYQFGESLKSIYFTSLINTSVINSTIRCKVFNDSIQYKGDKNIFEDTILTDGVKVKDYSCWIGIQITEELLSNIDEITVCVLLDELTLYPYLNTLSVFNQDDKVLSHEKKQLKQEDVDESHYFDDIVSYYDNYFYTIKLDDSVVLKTIEDQFPSSIKEVEGIDYEEKLLWVKFNFAEVFEEERLKNIKFEINVVPIVNRKRMYSQHNFKKNGKIASLPSERENYFLNVKKVYDDRGNVLKNVLKSNEDKLEGVYSLYFGNIEKFDNRSAKTLINKVSHLIREEGNAFAAMNPEKLNTYLHGIVEKLDEIERKAVEKLQHVNTSNERAFLMTYPHVNTTNYEIEYWVSNAELGNGFDESSDFLQLGTSVFDMKRVKLLTKTFGGKTRRGEREQIDSLRYGLLTRERIVSVEDVKSYIKQQIGSNIENIDVRPGMMISEDKKKGILRTVEVIITLNGLSFSEDNSKRLGVFLENELAEKSISNTPYKIILQN